MPPSLRKRHAHVADIQGYRATAKLRLYDKVRFPLISAVFMALKCIFARSGRLVGTDDAECDAMHGRIRYFPHVSSIELAIRVFVPVTVGHHPHPTTLCRPACLRTFTTGSRLSTTLNARSCITPAPKRRLRRPISSRGTPPPSTSLSRSLHAALGSKQSCACSQCSGASPDVRVTALRDV